MAGRKARASAAAPDTKTARPAASPCSTEEPPHLRAPLTLDFDNRESFQPQHYAFKVSEAEFDEIFARLKDEGLAYGSEPWSAENGEINHWNEGLWVYFRDPNRHLLELLTRDYTPEQFASR